MSHSSIIDENITVDGDSSVIPWHGGPGTFAATGTFGGGTVSMVVSYDDGGTYIDAGPEATITAEGHANFDLPQGQLVKVTLSGSAGASVNVNVLPRPKHR